MIDLLAFQQDVEERYEPMVLIKHGNIGVQVLKKLLEIVHAVYQQVDPSAFQDTITIFKTLDDSERPISDEPSRVIFNLTTLSQDIVAPFTIQILDNGEFLLWNQLTPDHIKLSEQTVVYTYHDKVEKFFAKGEVRTVRKLDPSYASMFAIPTFSKLKNALEHYRTEFVRHCSCPILETAWHDTKHIFFKKKPEHIMRDSLTHFLKISFRGNAEVRPEQIVDATHPVDIKVSWWGVKRLALIEIKWLGKPKGGKMYTDYRAREGAKQLADYLDKNKVQAPSYTTIGYLVVIDGRRKGLKKTTVSIDSTNGLHYLNKEIQYNPKYHEIRPHDFEEPIRMFVEPICN